MNTKNKVLDMVYIAICAALLAICSWIYIPTPAIQFTLQTMGVFFALSFLGGKKGTLSVVIFILLGAVGIPVFSGFNGGIGVLLGATGGYIVGFIFMGLVYILFEAIFKKKFPLWLKVIALVLGLIVCYAFGTAWFIEVYTKKSAISLAAALSLCVVPFIIPDLCKLAVAVFLSTTLKKALKYN